MLKVFSKPLEFRWDKGNKYKNWNRHKVRIQEAEEVFKNEPNFVFPDKRHSREEKRNGIFGITNEARPLTIIFTIREEKIRVISARDMSKKERRAFRKLLKEVKKNE